MNKRDEKIDSIKEDIADKHGKFVYTENLLDINKRNPTDPNLWEYDSENGSIIMNGSEYSNMIFEVNIQKTGKVIFSFVLSESGNYSINASIRSGSTKLADQTYTNSGKDGLKVISANIEEVGIYRFMFCGTKANSHAVFSEIMVNIGKRIEYVPHKILLVDKINKIEERIPSSVSDNIKSYNYSAMLQYIDEIKQEKCDLAVSVITDTHNAQTESMCLMTMLANSGAVDLCLNLGDTIPTYFETRKEALDCISNIFDTAESYLTGACLYHLKGNHDSNLHTVSESEFMIDDRLFYNHSRARTKVGYAKSGKNYGFIDFETAKIRVVFLDANDIFDPDGNPLVDGKNTMIQQEQFEWFANTALNFSNVKNKQDWAVIIASHDSLSQLSASIFGQIIERFLSGSSGNVFGTTSTGGYENRVSFNVDYTEQGGLDIICSIHGHHHKDMIRNFTSTIQKKQIYVACDGMIGSAMYDDNGTTAYYNRHSGTIEEHIIDTLLIDKANRSIKIKRFGIGSDREVQY